MNKRDWRDLTIIVLAVVLPLSFSLYFAHENIGKLEKVSAFKVLLSKANYSYDSGYYTEAINYSNIVLNNVSSEEYPEQYAMAQYIIGNSYYILSINNNSENKNFTADNSKITLENSIDAYVNALKVYDFDNYPIQYAFTNYHLGDAYRCLGLLYTNSTADEYIFKSKDAYNTSLRVINEMNYPEEYFKITQYVPSKAAIDYLNVDGKDSVEVASIPNGASIYLDDTYEGETPKSIENVEQGSHTITLKLEGYDYWSQNISVDPGKKYSLFTTLAKSIPTPTAETETPTVEIEDV